MPDRQPPLVRQRQSSAKAVGDCTPVSSLRERASALAALDGRLRQALPPPLREQVRLADLRGERLVFLAATSASAARLRACRESLLVTAQELGVRIGDVVVKVGRLPHDTYVPPKAKPLPHAAANHLRKAAHSLSDHELKALFLNLASLADDDPAA